MIYVLCVELWGGTHYYTEIVNAYGDEQLAYKHMRDHQGKLPQSDTRYYVEAVRLIGEPVK